MNTKLPDRDSAGLLPAYAWPGGYTLVYHCADGGWLCADCANKHGQTTDPTDKQWHITGADIHWEGPDMECDHCACAMPSEYGDPEA